MLTGRRFIFVGGDLRQLEVIQQVVNNDATVTLVGFELCNRTFTDTTHADLTVETFAGADALVLPVAGMAEDGSVQTRFSREPLILNEHHFAALKPGAKVFTGIARNRLESICSEYGLCLVKLMEQDEVAILNSIPTAEGAIALAMEKTEVTIHDSNVVVLGFGRCGKTLSRTLHALGAHVRVVAKPLPELARIREMGMQDFPFERLLEAVQDADIVFNTIPALVLPAAILKEMRLDAVIIDIASAPGGTDFRYAERRGMTAILAPSLPGIVAPKTAGKIIAESICRLMNVKDAEPEVHEKG